MKIPATQRDRKTNNEGTLFNWYDLGLYSDLVNTDYPEYELPFTVNQLNVTITRGKKGGVNSYQIIKPPQTLFFNQDIYIALDSGIPLQNGDQVSFKILIDDTMRYAQDFTTIFGSSATESSKIAVQYNSAYEWVINGGSLEINGIEILNGEKIKFDTGIADAVFTVGQTNTDFRYIGCASGNNSLFLGTVWDFDINGEHFYPINDASRTIADSQGNVNGSIVGPNPQWIDNPLFSLNGLDSYAVDYNYVPLMISINGAFLVVGQDGLYPYVVEADGWKYAVTVKTASDGDHVLLGLEVRS